MRKNGKVTLVASEVGIETAIDALKQRFNTKVDFAKSSFVGRGTITKFFQREPIQSDSFQQICKELDLNWRDLLFEAPVRELSETADVTKVLHQEIDRKKTNAITAEYSQNGFVVLSVVLEGEFSEESKTTIITKLLDNCSGHYEKLSVSIHKGSIRLIIGGTSRAIQEIVSKIESAEITEVNGFPIESIEIISDGEDRSNDKWGLVQRIQDGVTEGTNLSEADLSGANLIGANLRGANLRGANLRVTNLRGADLRVTNLIGADLSGANLRGANLRGANLRGANLSGANLSEADLSEADLSEADLRVTNLSGVNLYRANLSGVNLRGANLIGADLRNARVEKARFGSDSGISDDLKNELIDKGAIFEDNPGDRSENLVLK
jgi:Pentapeptide repeats (8 copies)